MMTRYTVLLNRMTALWLGAATAVLAGCQETLPNAEKTSGGSASTSGGSGTATADTSAKLCPEGLLENGGPQGRLIRGGCLEPFIYVTAERQGKRISPPEALPDRVTGFHHLIGKPVELRVATNSTDNCVKDQNGGSIATPPLYDVLVMTSDKGLINLCSKAVYEPDKPRCADESDALAGKAIAVPGYWHENGEHRLHVNGESVFTLACISGVAAKCVHWGYVPGVTFRDGTKLDGYHEACVRASRAQYFATVDKSFTCPGNEIDTFDKLGIRGPEDVADGRKFEAAWGESGLVCLSRPRYNNCDDEVTKEIPPNQRCKQEYSVNDAWPPGALIMNRSKPKPPPNGQCPDLAEECRQPPRVLQ